MAVTPLAAQEQQRWYERLRFDGDFRVRYESFRQEEAEDRGRLRIRLRAGFTLPITSTLTTGFRLASAEPGSVTSHNVNLSGGLTPKNLFIDRAWLSWTPSDRFTITGGKFGNPLERAPGLMRSELIFDDEVAPEGFHEQLTLVAGDSGVLRYLALLGEQWTLQEFSDRADSWMLGGQAVMSLAPSERSRITLAAGYYGFLRGNSMAQARNGNSALLITNTVVLEDGSVLEGGQPLSPPAGNPFLRFASDFRLISGSAGISLDRAVGSSPIQLYGDVVYNDGAEDQNLGWWAGLSLGT
ncbi:MAG TPA: putative porin, partial [Gemmatimonadales bacterium]|nr:putative porin [Gemmatimonadales bacterium]